MNKLKILILTNLSVFIFQNNLIGCTTFCLRNDDQIVLCKNLDWNFGYGHIEINKRGLFKKAFVTNNEIPVEWISKYGSITFNHIGKEFPLGGMNEVGLVIEEMNYYRTAYPEPDNRPTLNELQWIQYQLDNCATVEDVIKSDSIIRITRSLFKIHYLISDKNGNVATIEFLNGKMVYHTKSTLPVPVLTNHKYDESVDKLKNYIGFGGDWKIHQEYGSLNNFIKVSSMIQNYNPEYSVIDCSFDILSSVSTYDTQWSIVYDISNYRIYFKTIQNNKLKWIDLKQFDFSCITETLYQDVNTKQINSLNDTFKSYNLEINNQLVNNIYKDYSTNDFLGDEFKEQYFTKIANYPETLICKDKD